MPRIASVERVVLGACLLASCTPYEKVPGYRSTDNRGRMPDLDAGNNNLRAECKAQHGLRVSGSRGARAEAVSSSLPTLNCPSLV